MIVGGKGAICMFFARDFSSLPGIDNGARGGFSAESSSRALPVFPRLRSVLLKLELFAGSSSR